MSDAGADPKSDPAEVLEWARQEDLVSADCTVEELPPPAFRAYAQWRRSRDIARAREEKARRETADWWSQAMASTRAFREDKDRRDRIREWGEQRGWQVGRAQVPRALEEAYEVAEEGRDGQTGLF